MKAGWLRAGEGALLLRFREEVSDEAHSLVRHAFDSLVGWEHPALLNLHPAYGSLLVEFDPLQVSFGDWCRLVERRFAETAGWARPESRLVEIPVHYDGEDLGEVAKLHGISIDDVVALHSGAEYTVHFLGFQPGFPYLAGLPEKLETPRLAVPRLKVPAGSVAIAGKQAGIYPAVSAGGWRLLGRTPLRLFQADAEPPTLLRMGDRVRFRPLSREELGHA
jgi:inhibitor of KinA